MLCDIVSSKEELDETLLPIRVYYNVKHQTSLKAVNESSARTENSSIGLSFLVGQLKSPFLKSILDGSILY